MMTLDRADLVAHLVEMRNRIDAALTILVGNDEQAPACSHPPESIVDASTMDDDGDQYRCTRCGLTKSEPFYTET
jgi:hypothetical protein